MANNNWAKKIARFNTTKAAQNKKPQQQQKEEIVVKKKWPKVVLGLAIVGVLTAGIAIPLSVAAKKTREDFPTLRNTDKVFTIALPDGKEINVTYEDLLKNNEKLNSSKHIYTNISDQMAFYLYEQEYKASAWYEAVYNANKTDAQAKHFKLRSLDDIKKSKTDELNNLENRFQKQFGYEKWQTPFKEELAKEQYGKSNTKEDAINYLVAQEIKKDAFRRYQIEINSDFTVSELINGIVANKDVKYTYWDSKQAKNVEVKVANKGDVIHFGSAANDLHFLKASGDNANVVIPQQSLVSNTQDTAKVYAFTTKSFVNDQKDATVYVDQWLATKPVISSEITLPMTQNQTSADLPFKFAKNDLKKLLAFTDFKTESASEIDLPINRLNDFSGIKPFASGETLSSSQKLQALNDSLLLSVLGNENASTYGSNGFQSIQNILKDKKAEYWTPYISIINNDSLFKPQVVNDFYAQLKQKIIEVIFKNSPSYAQILTQDKKAWSQEEVKKAIENNKKIATYIDDLTNYDELMGNILRDLLKVNDSYQAATVYQFGDNKAFLNTTGLHILSTKFINSRENAFKLIMSDLNRYANNVQDSSLQPLFKVKDMFNTMFTDDFKMSKMLSDAGFVEYLKTLDYKPYLSTTTQKYTDQDINRAKDYSKNILNESNSQFLVGKQAQIKEYVAPLISKELNSDYVYNASENKWYVKGHDTEEYVRFIFHEIKNQLSPKGDK
ncbi:HinT-interacting membrane complex protein P80 [[Mycoplasma] gypis]|uniref:Membrane protein P80 n=1 Tax=[Mycoplasma] gypis TaxID=92404 RepID=A0ABZ2RPI5_9BACT|nr:hypothetical protein [[Mycoplasma] gypis]MBN0919546.1 hypothetical protein [[Mycoplasma] gypis]